MINVQIREQAARSCLKPKDPPHKTGQIEVLVDGSLAGFLGPNDGDGVRLHNRFPPGEVAQILQAVRDLRPEQEIPTITQAPEAIAVRQGTQTADMET